MTTIVLGSQRQEVVQEISKVLSAMGIQFAICSDSYGAMAELGGPGNEKKVIIGAAYFFSDEFLKALKSAGGDLRCFCFINAATPSSEAGRLTGFGATILGEVQELKTYLEQEQSQIAKEQPASKTENAKPANSFEKRMAFLADNFFLTSAEQNALLGDGSNGK